MQKEKYNRKRRIFVGCGLICMLILVSILYRVMRCSSPEATIWKITKGKADACLTIGVWENGEASYHVYGENGMELPKEEHQYAIGSVTKTFTGALIAKQIEEGKLNLAQDISAYLPTTVHGITLQELVTHTSGLSNQWEEELEQGKDSFSREDMITILEEQDLPGNPQIACYSNFGAALAGSIAANVEETSYEKAMNAFLQNDLKLADTKVGGNGDLEHYWNWKSDDEMLAAGAIISDISDMLQYGVMNMQQSPGYLSYCQEPLEEFGDGYNCGIFWLIDKENGYVWHNGEICMEDENGNDVGFQSFLGFSRDKNRVVVVLSNVIANDPDDNAYTDILGYQLLGESE